METPEGAEARLSRLRDTIELLQKREALLQAKWQAEAQNARQNYHQGDKRAALAALKRRRTYREQQYQAEERRTALEAQLCSIESTNGQTLVELASEPQLEAPSPSNTMGATEPRDAVAYYAHEDDIITRTRPYSHEEDVVETMDRVRDEIDSLPFPFANRGSRRPGASALPTQNELDELAALEKSMAM